MKKLSIVLTDMGFSCLVMALLWESGFTLTPGVLWLVGLIFSLIGGILRLGV